MCNCISIVWSNCQKMYLSELKNKISLLAEAPGAFSSVRYSCHSQVLGLALTSGPGVRGGEWGEGLQQVIDHTQPGLLPAQWHSHSRSC